MMKNGKLYLIPNFIDSGTKSDLPANQLSVIYTLTEFVAESEKNARAFLKSIEHPVKQNDFEFHIYNEHNNDNADFEEIFKNAKNGKNIGLISDAGIPCVADPGSKAVYFAHKNNIEVVPMGGNSSIFLALMASGLNGQQFTFNGYLPLEPKKRLQKIKSMEKEVFASGTTQIFMETPYRNNQLLDLLQKNLNDETVLFVAAGISSPSQILKRMKIKNWKKEKIEINKIPAIFILGN